MLEFPRWKGSLARALGICFALALGEVAAVSLFYGEDLITLPLVISRWMAHYRFEEAQAVASVLFFFVMIGIGGLAFLDYQFNGKGRKTERARGSRA